MTSSIAIVIVGDTPSLSTESMPSANFCVFYSKTTHTWYEFKDGAWVEESAPTHLHPILGDINFTGTVSTDGSQGLTGEKILGGFKFTFKKGLLVGFAPV